MRVVVARSEREALRALDGAGPGARVLAGGTDLMVELGAGRPAPDLVVDVRGVAALRGIREEGGGLAIGALATCSDILGDTRVARHADLLAQAAREVGAVAIKNRATIGGNLGTASPAADLVPALFALGARVRLASSRGVRELAVEDFVTGYRATARAHDELIAAVLVPPRPPGERRAFRKVGTRRAQSIAKVVVALAVALDGRRAAGVRAAAGSVAERCIRLAAFERALAGRELDARTIAAAARDAARLDARPRDDVRSTAEYRRVVLARVLAAALSDLAGLAPA